jgi:hypothetical protein
MTPWFRTAAILAAASAGPVASAAILAANGDTFIQQGSASTNFGNSTSFTVKNDVSTTASSGTDRIGFIKFDLSSVVDPVTSATLVMTVTGSGTTQTTNNPLTFTVLGIPESSTYGTGPVSLEDFVEGDGGTDNLPANELRFNNTPGATNTVNGSFVRTSYTNLGTFQSTAASGQVTFTSSLLIDFLEADTNGVAGFVIVRDTDDANATAFGAAANNRAQLFVNQPVPEPGTVGLVAAGALLALRRRGRR